MASASKNQTTSRGKTNKFHFWRLISTSRSSRLASGPVLRNFMGVFWKLRTHFKSIMSVKAAKRKEISRPIEISFYGWIIFLFFSLGEAFLKDISVRIDEAQCFSWFLTRMNSRTQGFPAPSLTFPFHLALSLTSALYNLRENVALNIFHAW